MRVLRRVLALQVCGCGQVLLAQAAEQQSCPAAFATAQAAARASQPTVRRCPGEAPAAFAEAWQGGKLAGKDFFDLRTTSMVVRDQRVYSTVLAVVEDPTRTDDERLSALVVLVALYTPKRWIDEAWLKRPPRRHDSYVLPIHTAALSPIHGEVPLTASLAADLPRLFARLAANDPSPTIRAAGYWLRNAFALLEPAHTPLPAKTVTLKAYCGSAVEVQGHTDLHMSASLQVPGTDWSAGVSLFAGEPVLMPAPFGTVVVMYGGRELARLEDRRGTCTGGKEVLFPFPKANPRPKP